MESLVTVSAPTNTVEQRSQKNGGIVKNFMELDPEAEPVIGFAPGLFLTKGLTPHVQPGQHAFCRLISGPARIERFLRAIHRPVRAGILRSPMGKSFRPLCSGAASDLHWPFSR